LHLTHLHDRFVRPAIPFLAQVISGSGLNIFGVSSVPGSTLPASALFDTLLVRSIVAISTQPKLLIPSRRATIEEARSEGQGGLEQASLRSLPKWP